MMKWILLTLLLAHSAFAETSKIIPAFLEASEIYVEGSEDSLFLRPDVRAALGVLKENEIDPLILQKYIYSKNKIWELRPDDKYDLWTKKASLIKSADVPEIAVHASKMDVVEQSEGWVKDDIYVYFFVTDGVIPTGKVSSIYKGVGRGQSFFFNEVDRAIFPLIGVNAKRPENHIIIDYGIIESDGDDVKEMQKLSSIIIDIAIAVYSAYDPQNAQILINLRKEVKALAEMIIGLNKDDRMATGTIAYTTKQLEEMLKETSFVEITQKHQSTEPYDRWDYRLSFRILRK